MVKQCAIEDLEAGMVLARSVHDENADILLNEGTILSDQVIESLLERPIFSVYIRIEDPSEVQKDISSEAGSHAEELSGAIRVVPEKKTLLDTEYMELYNEVLQHLKNAFGTPGSSSQVNMEEVGELLEIWQWSLERALGVHGSVFGYYRGSRVFLNSVARPLDDGRVVLSLPVRDRQDSERSSGSDPVAPPFAVQIAQEEAERLVGEPIAEVV